MNSSIAKLSLKKKSMVGYDSGRLIDPLANYELDKIVSGLTDNPCDSFICHYKSNANRLGLLGFVVTLKKSKPEYLISVPDEVINVVGSFQEFI